MIGHDGLSTSTNMEERLLVEERLRLGRERRCRQQRERLNLMGEIRHMMNEFEEMFMKEKFSDEKWLDEHWLEEEELWLKEELGIEEEKRGIEEWKEGSPK